jgi:predicted Zn-dependent peptidase
MSPRIHTLSNGVRVVCDPLPGFETLALSVVAGRGARVEAPEQSGWAHLLEHMVFKGAGGRSARDIVEVIEASGGQVNAATGHERTSFQSRALKGGLDLAMKVTADLVLRPDIDPKELKREKGVILQEIAEARDTPDDQVFELAQAAAFQGQALGRPILGDVKTVRAAMPEALSAFRAALYAPDRLVVSAAGAVDEDELLSLAEACFGEAEGQGAPVAEPGRFVGGHVAEARRLEQAHLVLMLPAVGALDDDYFPLRLFVETLGGGMASRLFQEAREKRGLAYSIDAYADTYSDVGALGVYAGCAAKDAAALAEVCAREIRSLAARIEDHELARAKAQLKAHMFMARESLIARAEQAAGQILLYGRLFTAAEIAREIDAVTAADMARLGARLLAPRLSADAVLGSKAALAAGPAFEAALFA